MKKRISELENNGIRQRCDKCHKLNTFANRVSQQANLFPDRYPEINYKGDALEFLTELLIKLSPVDSRIGIKDYRPELKLDTGVDGYGIGNDGLPATVQVKFRSSDVELAANRDHLSNFVSTSLLRYKVPQDTKTNLLIVTNAKGLTYFTDDEMFLNQVRILGYDQLRGLLDNNHLFWDQVREQITKNLKK